jgi:flavin-dependent dehydrogenase
MNRDPGPNQFDAIIIGGGPGGSSAATFLARAGRRVLLLEKERFPRFHIGESLLPYNRRIFREMGLLADLDAGGFTRKFGAQFHLGNGSKHVKFIFRHGAYTKEPEAIQVERASFDHLLLRHATKCGAQVREEWTVTRFSAEPDSVLVTARDSNGETTQFRGAFLIDASGRGNLTGNQEGLRVLHPRLRKVALFGHFENVNLDPGEKGGDTVIVRQEKHWFWVIPLRPGKTSVGCVLDKEDFANAQETPEILFANLWQASAVMRGRLDQARALTPIQSTTDFSYRNRRFIGHRLLRVGDAAGFMDPIFSAGVYLAMYSGQLAARAVSDSIEKGDRDNGAARLASYEKRIYHSMRFYWEMVERFYTTPFMEIFLEPKEKWNLPAAVNAVLAGELEGGWALRWRMRLFFWLIKLQSRFPLVPKISFAEAEVPSAQAKPSIHEASDYCNRRAR